MRRKDKQTSRERALETIDNCLYADMATVSPEGEPYCVPVSIVRDRSNIYFHCAKEGMKLDNIRANPSVCLCGVLNARNKEESYSVNYESAILFGKAYIVEDEEEKKRALHLLCLRHVPGAMDKFGDEMKKNADKCDVVRIEIEEITGKRDAG